jgi:hypothetical protein
VEVRCFIVGKTGAFFIALGVLLALTGTPAAAADTEAKSLPPWFPQLLGAQVDAIYQNAPGFHSPYTGEKSFIFDHTFKQQLTHVYGVYFGSQITSSLQAYADFEMFRGSGISGGYGLGGYTNADVIRAGPADLGQTPYLARLYGRYVIPLSNAVTEPFQRGMDQIPGVQAADRIEIKGGRFAPTDDFDQNRYANNGRTQFMNYGFLFNTAWDYASDTRGYSVGFSAAIVHPTWRLLLGSFQLPTSRNGMLLDPQVYRARGDQIELDLARWEKGPVVRLLAYRNQGRMGDYRDAMAFGALTGTAPNTVLNDTPGRVKYGFGINIEQPLANGGDTGLFARLGWANGTNSNWSYTESDRHASIGMQVSGKNWSREDDAAGIAFGLNGITSSHQHYLQQGGIGMLVGDGALNYGLEQVMEAYYRIQIGKYVQLSPDFQYIWNPAYNKDRGPIQVYGMRLRIYY